MDDQTRAAIAIEQRHLRRMLTREIIAIHSAVRNLTYAGDMTADLHNLATTVTGAAILAGRLATLNTLTPEDTP